MGLFRYSEIPGHWPSFEIIAKTEPRVRLRCEECRLEQVKDKHVSHSRVPCFSVMVMLRYSISNARYWNCPLRSIRNTAASPGLS